MKIGICEGRHPLPVERYVFPQEVNPLDVEGLQQIASDFFCKLYSESDGEELDVELYATGLTVAVLSAIKGAMQWCRNITVMHYDRESNSYYPQVWKI